MRWQLLCLLRCSITAPVAILDFGIYCGDNCDACCGGSYIRGIFDLIRGILYLLIRRIFFTALFARHFVIA